MTDTEILHVKIGDIHPYPGNPRKNDDAVDAVAASIREFGFRNPIIVDAEYEIIAGHTRWKAAKKLKLKTVPVIVADDLTEDQVKAYRLADNKTGEIAEWDLPLLKMELEDIDMDMSVFGFDLDLEFDVDVDDVVEVEPEDLPDEPITKLGDVIRLGDHVLMCGSSTNEEDVEKLRQVTVGEGEFDMMLTDPPYGVSYEDKIKSRPKSNTTRADSKIENDDMRGEDLRDFLIDFMSLAMDVLKDGAPIYIWHAGINAHHFMEAAESAKMKIHQTLIWCKNQFAFGRTDYHYQHEPCLCGWKTGQKHYFIDDRTKTTVLEYDKPSKSDLHPTMKPIQLMAELVNNSSKPGECVYDPFGGSGSTLIACEQLNRKCAMMELSPGYCDVIVNRWETLTGRKADRGSVDDGRRIP